MSGDFPLPHSDSWWLALILFLLFGSPALFSKAATRLPSVLGAAARWWQGRQVRATETIAAATKREFDEMVERRVDERTEDLVIELGDRSSWIANVTRWWRRAEIKLAEAGVEIEPPKPYSEWEADRKRLRAYHGRAEAEQEPS